MKKAMGVPWEVQAHIISLTMTTAGPEPITYWYQAHGEIDPVHYGITVEPTVKGPNRHQRRARTSANKRRSIRGS